MNIRFNSPSDKSIEEIVQEEKRTIKKRLFNPCKILENPDTIIQQIVS